MYFGNTDIHMPAGSCSELLNKTDTFWLSQSFFMGDLLRGKQPDMYAFFLWGGACADE
jgi:hypothetical protein